MQNLAPDRQPSTGALPKPASPSGGKVLGVMPKVTGFDAVIWLHRAEKDKQPFVIATPGKDYTDITRAVFCIEPMLIQVSPELEDFDVKHDVASFVEENISTILSFWEGDLTEPAQVIALIRKSYPRR